MTIRIIDMIGIVLIIVGIAMTVVNWMGSHDRGKASIEGPMILQEIHPHLPTQKL